MSHSKPDCYSEGFKTALHVPGFLANEIVRQGGKIEALDLIVENDEVRAKLVELLLKSYGTAGMIRFKVTVDSRIPLRRMIKLANLSSDPKITAENFDDEVKNCVDEVELGYIAPVGPMSTPDVIKFTLAENFRMAKLRQGLAFSARYPGIQLQHPLICAGSIGRDPTDGNIEVVPLLSGDKVTKQKILALDSFKESMWEPTDRFLVELPPKST